MDRASLERLTRQELIERARRGGVERPEVMTRDELCDELLRLGHGDGPDSKRARGWFGVARDLLAGLVEQGLHLPDAAKVIRGDSAAGAPSGRRPLATVTLAEIYAAQGHLKRGVSVLQEVLDKEPEHELARRLLVELEQRGDGQPEDGLGLDPIRSPSISHKAEEAQPELAQQVSSVDPEAAAPTLRTRGLDQADAPQPEPSEVAVIPSEQVRASAGAELSAQLPAPEPSELPAPEPSDLSAELTDPELSAELPAPEPSDLSAELTDPELSAELPAPEPSELSAELTDREAAPPAKPKATDELAGPAATNAVDLGAATEPQASTVEVVSAEVRVSGEAPTLDTTAADAPLAEAPTLDAAPARPGAEAVGASAEITRDTLPDPAERAQQAAVRGVELAPGVADAVIQDSAEAITEEVIDNHEASAEVIVQDLSVVSADNSVAFIRGRRAIISWVLGPASFERLRTVEPDGAPALRVVWWVPGLPARRTEQELSVTQSAGELLVELEQTAQPDGPWASEPVVRAVLGWRSKDQFRVVSVAAVLPLDGEGESFRPHAAAVVGELSARRQSALQLAARYS